MRIAEISAYSGNGLVGNRVVRPGEVLTVGTVAMWSLGPESNLLNFQFALEWKGEALMVTPAQGGGWWNGKPLLLPTILGQGGMLTAGSMSFSIQVKEVADTALIADRERQELFDAIFAFSRELGEPHAIIFCGPADPTYYPGNGIMVTAPPACVGRWDVSQLDRPAANWLTRQWRDGRVAIWFVSAGNAPKLEAHLVGLIAAIGSPAEGALFFCNSVLRVFLERATPERRGEVLGPAAGLLLAGVIVSGDGSIKRIAI